MIAETSINGYIASIDQHEIQKTQIMKALLNTQTVRQGICCR
ncbi:MAG: hypothetical protein ACFNUU_08200 [Campylobacter sp.]